MARDDLADDVEAEAEARHVLGALPPPEGLEHPLHRDLVDAHPAIRDRDLDLVGSLGQGQLDVRRRL